MMIRPDLQIVEGIAGTWHYHLAMPGHQALCGAETMPTRLPLATWGLVSSHIHESYCKQCEHEAYCKRGEALPGREGARKVEGRLLEGETVSEKPTVTALWLEKIKQEHESALLAEVAAYLEREADALDQLAEDEQYDHEDRVILCAMAAELRQKAARLRGGSWRTR